MKRMLPVVLLLSVMPLFAQEEIQENIEVVARRIRVYVSASDGSPLRGLKRENFQITENGKVVDTATFEEVDADANVLSVGADALEPESVVEAQRVSILLLDSANLTRDEFDLMKKASVRLIDQLRPNEMLKIIHFDDGGRDLTPFTTDKDILREGIAIAEYTGGLRRQLRSYEREIADAIPTIAQLQTAVERMEEELRGTDPQNLLYSQIQTGLIQVRARRDVVAEQTDLIVTDKEFLKAAYFKAYLKNMSYLANLMKPLDGEKNVYLMSGGIFLEQSGEYLNTDDMAEDMTAVFNSVGATVHSVFQFSNKPLVAITAQPEPLPVSSELAEAIGLDNVNWRFRESEMRTINSLTEEYTGRRVGTRGNNTVQENTLQVFSGIEQAARDTGGFFERMDRTDPGQSLTDVYKRSGHYYVLSYRASDSGNRAKVKVALQGTKGKLRYGGTLGKPLPYNKMSADEQEGAFKAELLMSQVRRMDVDAKWSGQVFYTEGVGFTSAVSGSLAIPEHSDGRFDVGIAALNAERDVIDFSFTRLEKVPEGPRMGFYDILMSDKRPKYLRVMVKHPNGDLTSSEEIRVPEMDIRDWSTHVSPLVSASGDRGYIMPLHALREKARKQEWIAKAKKDPENAGTYQEDPRVLRDPYQVDGNIFLPTPGFEMTAGAPIEILFQLNNFEDESPYLTYSIAMMGEEGAVIPKFSLVTMDHRKTEKTVAYHVKVDDEQLTPGLWQLWVKVVDLNASTEYLRKTDLRIVPTVSNP